jgi:hypothetical protein
MVPNNGYFPAFVLTSSLNGGWLPVPHDCSLWSRSHNSIHWLSLSKLCYDRWSVGQSVLVSSPPPPPNLGPKTRFLLLSDSCGYVDVGWPLWEEDGSFIYNCFWPSPAQSFSGLSPLGLMIIFYCLRFETPPTWRARYLYLYPPGTGFPFCHLWLAGLQWRYLNLPSWGVTLSLAITGLEALVI